MNDKTTLKERFEKQFVRRFTHGEDVNTSSGELLSFFRQELLALADSVEEWNKRDIAHLEDAATLIRAKAHELNMTDPEKKPTHSTEKQDRKDATSIFAPSADKGATVYVIGSNKNIPHSRLVDFFLGEGALVQIQSYGNATFDEKSTTDTTDWRKPSWLQHTFRLNYVNAVSLKNFIEKELKKAREEGLLEKVKNHNDSFALGQTAMLASVREKFAKLTRYGTLQSTDNQWAYLCDDVDDALSTLE